MTIVVLLSCLLSWSRENNDSIPFTGKLIKNDTTETTVVVLPIDIIREANIKLNERLIFKEMIEVKDKQLDTYKYIDSLSQNTIDNLIIKNNNLLIENNKIKKNINKCKDIIYAESLLIIILTITCLCN